MWLLEGLGRYVSSGRSLTGTTLPRQEFYSALHRCLMEYPVEAEILVPPFSYPSYSFFPRGGFVPTVKVIVLVPTGPTSGTFIQ